MSNTDKLKNKELPLAASNTNPLAPPFDAEKQVIPRVWEMALGNLARITNGPKIQMSTSMQ